MSFWLISVPGEDGRDATWRRLKQRTSTDNDLCENYRLEIPDLRVGTLDSLMALSDDLIRIDQFCENATHKVERELRSLSKSSEPPSINQAPVERYLSRFAWEEARYPIKSTLRELVDMIHQQIARIDEDLKVRSGEFNQIVSALNSIERSSTGSLVTRSLQDIVRHDDVVSSENICTLFVVLPKSSYKDFLKSYEKLVQFVVPKSAKLLKEDGDLGLYRVVLFKRAAEEFKTKARELKYTVRDFEYDPEKVAHSRAEKERLTSEKERTWTTLLRWLKTAYSESFIAWLHLKMVRLFIESVLRYGLPEKSQFVPILLRPHSKTESKLRKVLGEMYGDLLNQRYTDREDVVAGQEFYPYVYLGVHVHHN